MEINILLILFKAFYFSKNWILLLSTTQKYVPYKANQTHEEH